MKSRSIADSIRDAFRAEGIRASVSVAIAFALVAWASGTPVFFRKRPDANFLFYLLSHGSVMAIFMWLYLKKLWARFHSLFHLLVFGLFLGPIVSMGLVLFWWDRKEEGVNIIGSSPIGFLERIILGSMLTLSWLYGAASGIVAYIASKYVGQEKWNVASNDAKTTAST